MVYRLSRIPFVPGSARVLLGILLWALMCLTALPNQADCAEKTSTFSIRSFSVEGNTLLSEKTIREVLKKYVGRKKTEEDVNKARDALEKFYHDEGYPAVLVNLPQQTVKKGVIRFEVIESKIGKVRVTGNRYYAREKILNDLPSFAPGKTLYVPDVQKDLAWVNRGQDLKVAPTLAPGVQLGTTDVELKVEDKLPFHGSLEVNNYSAHDTPDLRLNAMLKYDNLWQKDHSISFQFQTSPADTGAVRMYALSYSFPAPWAREHQVALYGIKSDSNTTTFGQDVLVNGKGYILGLRYVIPLAPYRTYFHNITLGIDYKDFTETNGLGGSSIGDIKTPISYVPLSFAYNASVPDSTGITRFSANLNMALRAFSDEIEFLNKRAYARGNYIYFTGGIEREQKLPFGMGLFCKLDGQISDQPLISNEQYIAGGMRSVRGYLEAEATGDDAVHGTIELSAPEISSLFKLGSKIQVTPYLFYDFAWLEMIKPLPSENERTRLQGTGIGIKGTAYKNLYYNLAYALPLVSTDRTERLDPHWYFKVGVEF